MDLAAVSDQVAPLFQPRGRLASRMRKTQFHAAASFPYAFATEGHGFWCSRVACRSTLHPSVTAAASHPAASVRRTIAVVQSERRLTTARGT